MCLCVCERVSVCVCVRVLCISLTLSLSLSLSLFLSLYVRARVCALLHANSERKRFLLQMCVLSVRSVGVLSVTLYYLVRARAQHACPRARARVSRVLTPPIPIGDKASTTSRVMVGWVALHLLQRQARKTVHTRRMHVV